MAVAGQWFHASRYARACPIRTDLPFIEAAIEFLLGDDAAHLHGAVLLAASDDALETIAFNREALSARYLLDLSNPTAQQAMLDKLTTYKIAQAAGVATPRYWEISSRAEIDACRAELVYPLIVKPVLSHVYQHRFKTKFLVAHDFEELCAAYQIAAEAQIEVMLVEQIPGPDSRLCSYYTYLEEDGRALFDFTKRIIRRYPTNMGLATYHITDRVEGVREPALQLFRAAELRGLANAEFKLDTRDGQLKLIECNARFTAANGLIARAGLDLSSLVYNRLVGLPLPPLEHYRAGLTLWDPFRDFRAYRELSQRGELSFTGWLRSIMRPQMLPGLALTDPQPGLVRMLKRFRKRGMWR
jgi:predicted ATP-grasp superfamily ATP-dependent carboligase